MDLNGLRAYVDRVRKILELAKSELNEPFDSFPEGCCGDSVLVLGALLKEQGFGTFYRVGGERGDRNAPIDSWWSHAWLEKDGVIVDISGDQFSDFPREYVTEGLSAFHRTFREHGERCVASYLDYDRKIRDHLDIVFKLIKAAYEIS